MRYLGWALAASVATSTLSKPVDRTGYVKNKPTSWKDLFFQEAHGLPGS